MALKLHHSSIQLQSTTLKKARHKDKETLLKFMNSIRQVPSPNSPQNQLHLFLISLLRIATSLSPSSLDQVLAPIHFKPMNWQKTLTLF